MENNIKIDITDCWAKLNDDKNSLLYKSQSQSILTHSFLTGYVSQLVIENLVIPYVPLKYHRILRSIVPHITIHDIGKISLAFLCKSKVWIDDISKKYNLEPSITDKLYRISKDISNSEDEDIRNRNHHTKTGKLIIEQEFLKNKPIKKKEMVSDIQKLHHGYIRKGILKTLGRDMINICGEEDLLSLSAIRKEFLYYAEKEFGDLDNYIELSEEIINDKTFQKLIHGIVIISDWYASYMHVIDSYSLNDFQAHCQYLKETVLEELAKINYINSRENIEIGLTFEEIFSYSYNHLQKQIDSIPISLEDTGCLFLVDETMGGGKTEACLWLAYRIISMGLSNGFYFSFPTQVTSNSAYSRINKFTKSILKSYDKNDPRNELKIIHGNSFINKENKHFLSERIHYFFNNNKKGILYPYVSGTLDQALYSILNSRHANLRFFGIFNKVFIIDEMHSYNYYTSPIIRQTVKRILSLGGFVIISSGTLSYEQKEMLLKDILGENNNQLQDILKELKSNWDRYPLITKVKI